MSFDVLQIYTMNSFSRDGSYLQIYSRHDMEKEVEALLPEEVAEMEYEPGTEKTKSQPSTDG